MPKEQKVYGRYILELVADDINGQAAIGMHVKSEIEERAPKEIQIAVKRVLDAMRENTLLLMMSISDEEKRRPQ